MSHPVLALRELKAVQLRTLNRERAELVVDYWVHNQGQVPTPAQVSSYNLSMACCLIMSISRLLICLTNQPNNNISRRIGHSGRQVCKAKRVHEPSSRSEARQLAANKQCQGAEHERN